MRARTSDTVQTAQLLHRQVVHVVKAQQPPVFVRRRGDGVLKGRLKGLAVSPLDVLELEVGAIGERRLREVVCLTDAVACPPPHARKRSDACSLAETWS